MNYIDIWDFKSFMREILSLLWIWNVLILRFSSALYNWKNKLSNCVCVAIIEVNLFSRRFERVHLCVSNRKGSKWFLLNIFYSWRTWLHFFVAIQTFFWHRIIINCKWRGDPQKMSKALISQIIPVRMLNDDELFKA